MIYVVLFLLAIGLPNVYVFDKIFGTNIMKGVTPFTPNCKDKSCNIAVFFGLVNLIAFGLLIYWLVSHLCWV